jgi:hypothetical protein
MFVLLYLVERRRFRICFDFLSKIMAVSEVNMVVRPVSARRPMLTSGFAVKSHDSSKPNEVCPAALASKSHTVGTLTKEFYW